MAVVVSWITVLVVGYTVTLFFVGASSSERTGEAPDDLLVVFMIPCLDEELVIGRTISRLLEQDRRDVAVLVIDDGSTDRTAEIVAGFDPRRVWLLSRTLPEARLGKGEALNAGYRLVRDRVIESGRSPDDVILAVLDADGRLDPHAVDAVAPYFADPDQAAVQIKVRIHNAPDSILARLQDMEFATFTEVFQKARSRFGSSGLGGNGQFTRLTALMALGDSPWSDCLTEDLELGLQFLLRGWKNDFCPDATVSQQGVTNLGRLVRQRARWFQGHLQCMRFVPTILRSRLAGLPKFDLVFHLTNSVVMLVMQAMSTVWFVAVGYLFATRPGLASTWMFGGLQWLVIYVLAFGLAPFVAMIYWRAEPTISIPRGILLAHLYVLYSYLWFIAGLWALVRAVRGSTGWAKTARTTGTGDEVRPAGPSRPRLVDVATPEPEFPEASVA